MTSAPAKILVVEDNAITRKMVRVTLASEGYAVLEAADGAAALRVASRDEPSLVLLDFVLPDINGFDLVGKLRSLSVMHDVPIIAFTGFLGRLDEARLGRAGFNDILTKPVEPSRLIHLVGSYLKRVDERDSAVAARGARVLVVDDDPVQLKLQRTLLARVGYEVETVSSGSEALAAALASPPDVVLSDVLMPGMDGFRLTAAIRADPRLAGVPVVLISSQFVSEEDRHLARRVGAHDLVFRTHDTRLGLAALARALETPDRRGGHVDSESTRDEYLERMLTQLDRQAALNAGLSERASLRGAALAILGSIAGTLAQRADVEESIQETLSLCVDAAGLSHGAVFLRSPEGRWTCRAHLGLGHVDLSEPDRFFGSEGWIERFAQNRQVLVIGPESESLGLDAPGLLAQANASTLLVAPLESAGRTLGVLALFSAGGQLRADEWGFFAQAIASQLGQAIALGRAFTDLSASEFRYRTLYDSVPLALFRATLEGDLTDANPALLEMFGFSDLASLTRSPTHDRVARREERDELLTVLRRDGAVKGRELELRRADGTPFWGSVTARVMRNPAGDPANLQGVITDITDQKLALAALGESEQRFRQIAENIRDGFFISELAGGRTLYVSPTFESIWGHTAAEAYARPMVWLDWVHPDDRDSLLSSMDQIGRGEVSVQTFRVVRPDGSVRWLRGRAFPVKDASGRVHRMVGLSEDITEVRNVEDQARQAQKLEAIGRLAGGVAHDFNNLLTVILGECDMIRSELPAEHPILPSVQEVRKAGERAAVLTRQLLAFSRRQLIEVQVFELNAVVTDMDKMLRRLIGEDIEVATRLAADAGSVKADRGQIEQVVANLAVNARDAMPDGGALTLETDNVLVDGVGAFVEELPAGRYVRLQVSDTGVGMSDAVRSRLFEPFYTTKEMGKGTGLGLATCYGIVKQAGGHIAVKTALGKGSTFSVYLPVAEGQPATTAGGGATSSVPHGGETVLLVEDEAAVRRAAARLLAALGYRVLEAHNGHAAQHLAETHDGEIHLLLTDVVLPGGGGAQVAERVQVARPSTKVLFMSGYTDDVTLRHRVLEQGVPFMEKPFTRDQLARKVREVLDA